MSELDHWHPVALSRQLGARPRRVTLCGHDLVLFRSGPRVGALDDACAHRGFPLHRGRVDGERLVCPYHGWRWAPDGRGEAPGTPTAKPCARAWDCVERMGAVWVRRPGSDAPFPRVDVGGYSEITSLHRRIGAPLEVVLDNFIEVEHTPSVHVFLGYPAGRVADVTVETTVTDDAVHVHNRGPQRWLPWPIRRLFGVPREAEFVDDWTTRFSPVHTVYEQYFLDANSGERGAYTIRVVVFFTPVGPRETDLFVFAYTSPSRWERPLVEALRALLMRTLVHLETDRDAAFLAAMADAPVVLKGRALGRFDKALTASRKLIDALYRGPHVPR